MVADGIDLLNVSFEGSTAPDRISAIAGLAELERVSPTRRQISPASNSQRHQINFLLIEI